MNDEDFDGWNADELELESRAVLDTWAVPDPSPDLIERVMTRWEHAAQGAPRPRTAQRRRPPWLGAALTGALAAFLVLVLTRPDEVTEPAEPHDSHAVLNHPPDGQPNLSVTSTPTTAKERSDASTTAPSADASAGPKPERAPRRRAEPAKTATLRIGTAPGVPPAKVYINGSFVGRTPISEAKVVPGTHVIRFEFAERPRVTMTVTVGHGETKIVKGG